MEELTKYKLGEIAKIYNGSTPSTLDASNYDGDIIEYKGKRYFVSLAEERVEFVGIVRDKKEKNDEYC